MPKKSAKGKKGDDVDTETGPNEVKLEINTPTNALVLVFSELCDCSARFFLFGLYLFPLPI